MARIKTYGLDGIINPADKLIGSDGEPGINFGKTKNYSIQSLRTFFGTDLVSKDITITAAQMLSLNNGGTVEVIPAPGAGKIIHIMNALIHLDFATTAYNFAASTLSDGVGLVLGSTPLSNDNGFFITNLNSATDTLFIGDPISASAATNLTSNTAVNILSTSGITVSQGDSPIKVSILYREILIP